jgi:hypothetical protein
LRGLEVDGAGGGVLLEGGVEICPGRAGLHAGARGEDLLVEEVVPGRLVAVADHRAPVHEGDRAEVDPQGDRLAAMLGPRPAEGAEVEVVEEARHVEAERLGVRLEAGPVEAGLAEQAPVHGPELALGAGGEGGLGGTLGVEEAGRGQAAEDDPEVVAVVLEQVLQDLGGARAGRAGVVGVDDDRDERLGAALEVVIGGERDLVAPLGHGRGLGGTGAVVAVRVGLCGACAACQDEPEQGGGQNCGSHV